jgi:hypothetical protein
MFVNSDGQLKLPEGCKVIIPAVPSHTDPFSGRVLSSYWFEKYPTDAGDLTVGAGPASKAITNMYNQADIKKSVEAILLAEWFAAMVCSVLTLTGARLTQT